MTYADALILYEGTQWVARSDRNLPAVTRVRLEPDDPPGWRLEARFPGAKETPIPSDRRQLWFGVTVGWMDRNYTRKDQ